MSVARNQRSKKQQLGQFMTPDKLAFNLVEWSAIQAHHKVLEPSMGDGSFLIPLIDKLIRLQDDGLQRERFVHVTTNLVYGVELDRELYDACIKKIVEKWGELPTEHNLQCQDYFKASLPTMNWVIGNPPFGGTINSDYADALDSKYGYRNGEKIKKETYSFFTVKSLDHLAKDGQLLFICSDTFLTIPTMRGLRKLLMNEGAIRVKHLSAFSEETDYPMVTIHLDRTKTTATLKTNDNQLSYQQIRCTPNLSWNIPLDLHRYFTGHSVGDYMVATGGMTTGNNQLFLRNLEEDNTISEPYTFAIRQELISLDKTRSRARNNALSAKKITAIAEAAAAGTVEDILHYEEREEVLSLVYPHPDYAPYNKSNSHVIFAPVSTVVYWKGQGKAVLTYKKTGNWYLHGVGGKKFFGREGLTWGLIASRINMKYLPSGFILDSGAPCAFLREGVDKDELYFILGWTLTKMCSRLQKEVLNHTMNIQGKDIERLPYPSWISTDRKQHIVKYVKQLVSSGQDGKNYKYDDVELRKLDELFAFKVKNM